ncbi:MAG: hypothetical protein FJ138_13930, partial [Deltaproteobacteria bacterium]|nr:hypothetical protein [Deltaproteobacteria bacterium]
MVPCVPPVDPPPPPVDCDAAGRCAPNGAWCESAAHPACWAGAAPVCWDPDHPISIRHCGDAPAEPSECSCPDGFSVNPAGDGCVRATAAAATHAGARYAVCDAGGSPAYGWGGALYLNTDGDPTNDAVASPYWGATSASDSVNGRLNQVGVWACDAATSAVGTAPVGEWIGFARCLTVERAGDYLVGIAGDNRVRLKLNGQLVFERDDANTANFNYWHMRKVSLSAGLNIIELFGKNDGLIAAFGAEISGPFEPGTLNTEDQQRAADYAGRLIFSTRDMQGQAFDLGEASGWRCPEGVALNLCGEQPSCVKVEEAPCAETPALGCDSDAAACGANALCVDAEGGFECVCAPGFVGDGQLCAPVACPENASGAPCACDPGFVGQLTLDYEQNAWLGECAPADPCVGVECAQGETCEPASGACVSCEGRFRCVNGAYCEDPGAPGCWLGAAPVCYAPAHPLSQRHCAPVADPALCDCPDGFAATPAQDGCVRATTTPAVSNGASYRVCDANGSPAYGWAGALYEDTDGDATNNAVVAPYWGQTGSGALGRLNQVGVWACDAATSAAGYQPVGEWIGFARCLTLERAGDYLIGIAGDNRVRLKVDGQLVFERDDASTTNFNYWHIRKVSLTSGVHIIELSGYNDHAIAAFGAEISGPFPPGSLATEAQQKAADYAGRLVFSTGRLQGELFTLGEQSGWSCPGEAQALNTCAERPECVETERVDCLNGPVDSSGAYECVRGSYCETGDQPACWQGAAPVCYEPTHPL